MVNNEGISIYYYANKVTLITKNQLYVITLLDKQFVKISSVGRLVLAKQVRQKSLTSTKILCQYQ